jgi:hypothetical protein
VAARPPTGDPRSDHSGPISSLAAALAWYDRDVAAAVFEPLRAEIERAGDGQLESRLFDFVSWSMFDPRGAAARLARASKVTPRVHSAVAHMLSLPYDDRRQMYFWRNYAKMRDLGEVE